MTKKRIFKLSCLILYVLCVFVLIIEASMNGKTSAGQSNAVGGVIAGNINDIKGDTSKAIEPEKLQITNPITEAYVNDQYQLETELTPLDTTFQSLTYASSNEDIAVINPNGLISFLKAGEVTISVTNTVFTNIKEEINITVKNVQLEDFIPNIFDQNGEEILPTNGIYTFFLGNNYKISPTFIPENTTDKTLEVSLSNESYISVTSQLAITTLKYSENKVSTLIVSSNNIQKELKFVVELENIIPLEDFTYDNDSIYVSQTKSTKPKFTPTNATFKGYTLKSSDESICKIVNKTSYKGIKEGKVTITITSTKYPEIFKSFEVEVLAQPEITNFNVVNEISIIEDSSKTIHLTNITPKYAKLDLAYTSSNPEVASVNSKGVIKGIKKGTTIITITNNIITKQVIVTVNEKPETTYESISLKKLQEYIIFKGTEVDLLDYVSIDHLTLTDGTTSTSDLKFRIQNISSGTINNTKYTANESGIITMDIIHNASGISKTISFLVLEPYEIKINDQTLNNISQLSINVNDLIRLKLLESEHQKYDISVSDTSILIVETHEDHYDVKALASGTADIIITPLYDGIPYKDVAITLPITNSHIYSTSLDIMAHNVLTNKELEFYDNEISFIVGSKIQLTPIVSDGSTISQFSFKTNSDILSISNSGFIVASEAGKASITITELFSNISKTISVNITNYYAFAENAFVISGKTLEYNEDNNLFTIQNGNSATLKINFTDNSTYKEVTYISSNEKVLTIGKDGKITPISTGKSTITVICDDGNYEHLELEINIKIEPKPFIEDLSNFFYKVRKSLGHFGAFLVLGIFSSFTFMMYFSRKNWFYSIPINFIQGFGVAGLTELIQRFVPGRTGCWSDVWIDMSGFLFSAIFITLCFLIKELINLIKTIYQKKTLK